MFFLRNIHRRLITGFSLSLSLSIALASVGAIGLIWHQQKIDDLEYVLEKGPDRNELVRSFFKIDSSANIQIDSPDPDGVFSLQSRFNKAVENSRDALDRLRVRVEDMKLSSTEESRTLIKQRPIFLKHLNKIGGHLLRLNDMGRGLTAVANVDSDTQAAQLHEFRKQVRSVVDTLHGKVRDLPAYQDPKYLTRSLEKEKKLSRRLLIALGAIAAGTMISIVVMWYCGFRWVSNPLLEITSGASRIAEGDPDFRIPSVSRWQDEFSLLRTNVNLMADRFQDAERDLNRKVRERSQQLVRSERLAGLGFLAAGVAHEINNPLSIIRVAADTLDYRLHESLSENNPDREEILQRLSMIRNESARCGDITARILDFSRGDQSTACVDNITSVVQTVLAMVRPMPTYRDREIVFDRTTPLSVMMNSAQIKQVLLNLIFNALQATKPGGRVDIRLVEQCDWVVIEIEDDGCGMSEETMDQLFEPFYSTKPTGTGTGLGMCITHRIIEDHHGTIEPWSPGDGQGSLFRVRLPLRHANRDVA
ncbi:MAG: HAMP domain-containing histidine kinase [Fuerstiella sp.]|nr:HAMP domain-containing histidine kinase [Fuerstiella sp.]